MRRKASALFWRNGRRSGLVSNLMPLATFAELFALADAHRSGVPVAVAGGADVTVLEALSSASERGWVRPLLVGPLAEVQRLAALQQIPLERFTLVDATEDEAAKVAVAEVVAGRARLLMKGQIAT